MPTVSNITQNERCFNCNEEITSNALAYRDRGFLCRSCAVRNAVDRTRCSICHEEVYAATAATIVESDGNRTTLCPQCSGSQISPSFRQCAQCGSFFRDCTSCEYCSQMFCPQHAVVHMCRLSRREEFFKKTSSRKLIGEKTESVCINRLVGIELEVVDGREGEPTMSAAQQNLRRRKLSQALHEGCGIATDSSVSSENYGSGFEIITPPASGTELEKIIKDTCSACTSIGFSVNKTCGVHVHIDAHDFYRGGRTLSRLLRAFYAIEDIIFSLNPPSRWDNHYCQSLANNYLFDDFNESFKLSQFEQCWYAIEDKRFNPVSRDQIKRFKQSKYNYTKYSGINFHSTMHRGTIEFRHHAGSLNSAKILGWINVLLKIVNYAKRHYNDENIVKLYEMETGFSKLEAFIKEFRIDKKTSEYMYERIEKWNSKFKLFKTTMRSRNDKLADKLRARRESMEMPTASFNTLTYAGIPVVQSGTYWTLNEDSLRRGYQMLVREPNTTDEQPF